MKHILKVLDKKLEKLSKRNKEHIKKIRDLECFRGVEQKKIAGLTEEKRVLMMEIERLNEELKLHNEMPIKDDEENEKLCN